MKDFGRELRWLLPCPWMVVRGWSDDVERLVRLAVRILVVHGGPEAVVVRLVRHDLHAAVGKLHLVLAWKKDHILSCLMLHLHSTYKLVSPLPK